MNPVVIENARIVDPASGRDARGALWADEGGIRGIAEGAPPGAPPNSTRIDAKGLILAPGLIDMRVFTGEPGREYRETLASAGEAAAAGGVTSFVAMPDTQPAIDDGALVDFIVRRARATSKVNVLPAAAMTRGLDGRELTEFGLLREAGAVMFTDGRRSVQSSSLMKAALSYASNFGALISHLPFDGEGVMNAGHFASVRGLKGIPAEAETIPLARDLQLALMTGARYHAAAISTGRSAAMISAAREESPDVSCAASINSLTLNENDVGAYRTFFKLNPPLRAEADRQALVAALSEGVIDVIVSDHDPQDSEVKRQPFAEASFGAIGLETMLAAGLRLVQSGDVDLLKLLRAMTSRPADILGLPSGRLKVGAPADLILIDAEHPWQVAERAIRSRSRNTAFEGARLFGKVVRTFVGGVQVFALPD